MVAKSRPRRRPVVLTSPLDPADWPDWVLSFGRGYFPDDPVRQAVRTAEFHQWKRDRDAWFAERGIPKAAWVAS